MRRLIQQFLADQSGVTAVEYGLLVAMIGLAVFSASQLLGGELSNSFNYVGDKLKTR